MDSSLIFIIQYQIMNICLKTSGYHFSGWLLHRAKVQELCTKHLHSNKGRGISSHLNIRHYLYQRRAMREIQHSKQEKPFSVGLSGDFTGQLIKNLPLEIQQSKHDEKRLQNGKYSYQSECGQLCRFWADCLNNMEYFQMCETSFLFNISISVNVLPI